jgi:dihydropteroate synthase
VAEELRRVVPVISELAAAGACVSVDTMRAEVAAAAVSAGARLVNDVSGGQADPEMFAAMAGLEVPYVCMHWRGHAVVMQQRAAYVDVVAEIVAELGERLRRAQDAGIAAERLIVDPGFGFAKTGEHNWEILRRLAELEALHRPVLAGVSRKTFLGSLLADAAGKTRPAKERDDATTALTTYLAEAGVWGVRVHAVRASVDAVTVVTRLQSPRVHQ